MISRMENFLLLKMCSVATFGHHMLICTFDNLSYIIKRLHILLT